MEQIIIPCINVKWEKGNVNNGFFLVRANLELLNIPTMQDGVSLHVLLSKIITSNQEGTEFIIKNRFDEISFIGLLDSFDNTSVNLYKWVNYVEHS